MNQGSNNTDKSPLSMENKPKRDGYVFISYKREEVEKAKRIRSVLFDAGYDVWWDSDIQCGQVWNEVLDDAVKRASCIVVLWSNRSLQSRWVMHEASSAIDREIYTPIRIELCRITPPYNRLQATDIIEWNGKSSHPGVISMLKRVDELIPLPQSLPTRLLKWCQSNVALLAATIFAIVALSILGWQTAATRTQMSHMSELLLEIEKQSDQSEKILDGIDRTFNRLEGISGRVTLQLPFDQDLIGPYQERLKYGVDDFLLNPVDNDNLRKFRRGGRPSAKNPGGVLSIGINEGSEYFPQSNEQPIGTLLAPSIAIAIYKTPINTQEFHARARIAGLDPDLDLSVRTHSPVFFYTLGGVCDNCIEIKPRIEAKKADWRSRDGIIASLSDLPGCQLWVYVDPVSMNLSREQLQWNEMLDEAIRNFDLHDILLRFNDRELPINVADMEKVLTKDGYPAWVITLME